MFKRTNVCNNVLNSLFTLKTQYQLNLNVVKGALKTLTMNFVFDQHTFYAKKDAALQLISRNIIDIVIPTPRCVLYIFLY